MNWKTQIINQLKRHEGLRLKPYKDSVGKLTIGIGRNLDDVGISESEAFMLLENDIYNAVNELKAFLPAYSELDEVRANVLVNMVFNLGINRFMGFKKMIAALIRHDYELVAIEMMDSKWAVQVGIRALELKDQMIFGKYKED